jgi:hypothetical protein
MHIGLVLGWLGCSCNCGNMSLRSAAIRQQSGAWCVLVCVET